MKERIRELVELCTLSFVNMHGEWEDDFDKVKFAELIVRECCDMVNKHTQHNNSNDCLLVLDIKEHFGVEA